MEADAPLMVLPGDWESGLRRSGVVRGNVVECLERNFLTYDQERFDLTKIDRIASVLQCLLSTHGGSIVLVYPVDPCKLAPILALEALYARKDPDSRPFVLCITSDVSPRDEFMNLRNPGDALHRRFFPVGMLRGDGAIRDLSRVRIGYHGLEPRLIFSPHPRLRPPPEIASRLSAAILMVDARTNPNELVDFDRWANTHGVRSLVFVLTDPFSEQAQELLKGGFPVWGWNSESLRTLYSAEAGPENQNSLGPFSPPEAWLRNLARGHRFVVAPVEENRIGPVFVEARKRHLDLFRIAKTRHDELLLRATRSLLKSIYALEELPTPSSYYDREAASTWGTISIAKRLSGLQKVCDELKRVDPGTASFLEITRQSLEGVYALTSEDPSGKPVSLLAIIDEAAKRKASLAILVRNRAARRALESFLRSKGKGGDFLLGNQIYVVTPGELLSVRGVETLLFTSVPRYDQRSLLGFPKARNLAFLTYPSEIPVLEYLLKSELPHIEQKFSFNKQVVLLSSLAKRPERELRRMVREPPQDAAPASEIAYTAPRKAQVESIELKPVFETFFAEELTTIRVPETDAEVGTDDVDVALDIGPTPALAIYFVSGRTLIVRPQKEIPVYIEHVESVRDVPASKTKTGDLVVLVEESVKKSLLALAIERVERHPAMIEVVAFQRSWVEALRRGMEDQKDTPSTLLRKLQSKGSQIQTAVAIHLWRKGVIIGPEDKADIRRLGEVYQNRLLIGNVDKIYVAVERLRSIHRKLAQKLRYLAPRAGVTWQTLGDEELAIDPDLNLYLEDFSNSVTIEEIRKIEGPYSVDASKLNRTYGGDTWQR